MIDIFQPYRIGKLELRNRFVRSATWDATANEDGTVSDDSLAIFRKLARGNIGLIVTGFAYVSASGQAAKGQYGIHNDDMIQGLKKLTDSVHKYGGKVAVQIHHGGINALNSIQPALVVSELPEIEREQRVMTEGEIENLIDDFVKAVLRAREAGFDGVQFHGAHGYLLNQFISPVMNRRIDKWGGSIENRSRFHLEVIRRSLETVGADFPLLIKFGVPGKSGKGLTQEDSLWTAARMCKAGIDAIEVSADSSAMERNGVPRLHKDEPARAFFREQAAQVKRAVDIPVILVGGIRSAAQAGEIVNCGDADMIAMSRPFIKEPLLLKKWQKNAAGDIDCISCNWCFPIRGPKGEQLKCRKDEPKEG